MSANVLTGTSNIGSWYMYVFVFIYVMYAGTIPSLIFTSNKLQYANLNGNLLKGE